MSRHTRRLGAVVAAICLATAGTAAPIVSIVTAAPAAHALADIPATPDCCAGGG
jgi:hypothetical protein